ncbi:MBL fold metallo-hydrolase [candidate division KSB1 bacterium]
MKLTIHGAAKEVGRSCIELETDEKERFLFDAGVKLSEHGVEPPSEIKNPEKIRSVFISHAHLDHTGYLPTLDHLGMKCPIFATGATKAITKLLLLDAFKIGRLKREPLRYGKEDIEKAISFTRRVKVNEKGQIGKLRYRYFDAGHIPGSASVVVSVNTKKILYTGDINTSDTRLLRGAKTDYMKEDIDIMITEATYGNREHENRQKTEKEFLSEIEKTIERGGSVLIPAFAVGRAQEIISLLNTVNFGVPVYLDGMARKATEIILNFPKSVKNASELRDAYRHAKSVKGRIQRQNIETKQGIFVTTSGMLTGGPVIEYMKHIAHSPRNSILLTGYQAAHTNGRLLLEKGHVFIDGWKTNIQCNVKQFDFSAHSGQSQLRKMIKNVNPGKLIINHGDYEAVEDMYEWAQMLDIDVHSPDLGDKIII